MSRLRPECGTGRGPALPTETALYLIRDSVAKRRSLIHGRLHDQKGGHCAMGAFWTDNPKATIGGDLVDEVAAVNDSIPPTATAHQRWKKVMSWLRWRLRVLEGREERGKA
jgi:hypothetical protein